MAIAGLSTSLGAFSWRHLGPQAARGPAPSLLGRRQGGATSLAGASLRRRGDSGAAQHPQTGALSLGLVLEPSARWG